MITRLIIAIVFASILGCSSPEKITLEKIVFHSSRCFGSCPAYHAQIDHDKTILLYSEYVSSKSGSAIKLNDPDTTKVGYFTGKVNEADYSDLERELQNIGINDLQFDENLTCCDASLITIIVYYNNGKRKVLKSMFPPQEANRLIFLLYGIIESAELHRADQKFDIEGEE